MDAMDIKIFDHDNDVDVAHKINSMELHSWINHLTYVRDELNNLLSFYYSQTTSKQTKHENIKQHFEIKKVDNDVILNHLKRFQDSRSTIIECEDMNCDMSFIQEHEKCRRMFIYHIDKYRKLKDSFFKELKGKMTISSAAV